MSTSVEQLIKVANQTRSIRIVDAIVEAAEVRLQSSPGNIELEMGLEILRLRQQEVFEISLLEADFKPDAGDEIALEEEVNIALFKPVGE